jgi:formamidopyrimidine-DNA glycosylase
MPELPEVERARALIERRALGRRIAAVDDTDTYVCRPHAPGEIAGVLTVLTFTAAHRRG